ncbi:hypothetical protein AMTRI_Chr07g75260 [Amborella trichopoda]
MALLESNLDGDTFDLLNQFERILDSDPDINEVGFVHPTQLVALNGDVDEGSAKSVLSGTKSEDGTLSEFMRSDRLQYDENVFWNRDHKLAISLAALLPLYKAAMHSYTVSSERYTKAIELTEKSGASPNGATNKYVESGSGNSDILDLCFVENEVMRHSRAVLMLNCDFESAWNSRKLVVSSKQSISFFLAELQLSALILSYAPKSEKAWIHRRWVITMISRKFPVLQEILERESELVERIAEKSKMNYRAWHHRCWLVSYLTRRQVGSELDRTRRWAELHVADNCCFHYRRRLFLSLLETKKCAPHDPEAQLELDMAWKEELKWNQFLICRYIGRESLWVHRRFLSHGWINHIACASSSSFGDSDKRNPEIMMFLDGELELLHSCSKFSDREFDDEHVQAALAASYILWISRRIPQLYVSVLLSKFREGEGRDVKAMLLEACPEKSLLWEGLYAYLSYK